MERLFLLFVRMGLYASVLVGIVLALRLLLKRAPKRITCLLWALVAFRLLCPAQIHWRASLMPPPETVVQTVQEMPNVILPAQNAPTVTPEQTVPTEPAEPTAPTSAAPDLTAVLSRVWLAGMIAMLLWAAISDLRLRRRLRSSVRLQNGVLRTKTGPARTAVELRLEFLRHEDKGTVITDPGAGLMRQTDAFAAAMLRVIEPGRRSVRLRRERRHAKGLLRQRKRVSVGKAHHGIGALFCIHKLKISHNDLL